MDFSGNRWVAAASAEGPGRRRRAGRLLRQCCEGLLRGGSEPAL